MLELLLKFVNCEANFCHQFLSLSLSLSLYLSLSLCVCVCRVLYILTTIIKESLMLFCLFWANIVMCLIMDVHDYDSLVCLVL